MNIEELYQYCTAKKAVTEDFPFDKNTLVFKVAGKMFALCGLEKWEKGEKSINLKCDPDKAVELRASYKSINPGYHMSKTHWNTVSLNSNEISPEFLRELIDHSYEMVVKGLPKKLQKEIWE
ncbi:MmcQ/YjbR family DNA-binding protein [Galbibacter pacificus]|uniref:MmcQ/YjbR family DNA-binding protein n=1 Tax=Galbibacter pacificus TaxID=2996052 RepID=A0ABT6FSG4_9FLAO|nr:MmcQ/YjbR family DNA-binding protein [Galbibacter pacificus]MDG3582668.1 MmcQ/YjbR family DNA-binding protein [Galbibacter pacificus]MDG3586213.1 MmcQ/YjbR family DNA-binding protein [Galbibacter pacificus]